MLNYSFFFQAEDGIRDGHVTGVQTCALPISYFDGMPAAPPPIKDIRAGRVLCLLGDSITTDHISPAGSIRKTSPAGRSEERRVGKECRARWATYPVRRKRPSGAKDKVRPAPV